MTYRPRLRTACKQPHPAQSFPTKSYSVSATADQTRIKNSLLSCSIYIVQRISGTLIHSEVLKVASNIDYSLQENAEADLLKLYTLVRLNMNPSDVSLPSRSLEVLC